MTSLTTNYINNTIQSKIKQPEPQTTNKQEQPTPTTNTNPQVIYVSKNPDRAVAATGVIAGTSGMIGGAALGGIVGLSKLPTEYARTIAQQDYSGLVTASLDEFKSVIATSPELQKLATALKSADSPAMAEEVLEVAGTLSEKLHKAFASDPHAASVIDKVVDPIIKSVSVTSNIRNYGSGIAEQVKSPLGQGILKALGFNKNSSKIVGGIVGNITEGIMEAITNIKNFTPEEKAAWKQVSEQIFTELKINPKVKVSKGVIEALYGMAKDTKWITEPIKKLQSVLVEGLRNLDTGLGNAPIKTIGKCSAIGAAACTAASLAGWGLLKGMLFRKEAAATNAQN